VASSNITLLFVLRQDASFWCLDHTSVKSPNTQESVRASSFESNSLSAHCTFCSPSNSAASGRISTNCLYTYYDGAVGNSDYFGQSFVTTADVTLHSS